MTRIKSTTKYWQKEKESAINKNMKLFYLKKKFIKAGLLTLTCLVLISCHHLTSLKTGNVIFFHPDGMSLSHWDIGRIITVGPDGLSSWDKLPHMAVYKGHLTNNLVPSSNAGAPSMPTE